MATVLPPDPVPVTCPICQQPASEGIVRVQTGWYYRPCGDPVHPDDYANVVKGIRAHNDAQAAEVPLADWERKLLERGAGPDAVPTEAYQLIAILAGEVRAATGHWIPARPGPLSHLIRHDARMPDRSCLTCAVLDLAQPWAASADPFTA